MQKKYDFFPLIKVLFFIPLFFGLLNAIISHCVLQLRAPLYMDGIFTAASSLVFGLVPGVLTALWTHFFLEAFDGFKGFSYPWIFVSMGTVISMRVVSRFSKKIDIAVFLNTVLLLTLTSSLLGSMVSIFIFKSVTHHPCDQLVTVFLMLGGKIFPATFWSRILINLVDQSIAAGGAFCFYLLIRSKTEHLFKLHKS